MAKSVSATSHISMAWRQHRASASWHRMQRSYQYRSGGGAAAAAMKHRLSHRRQPKW